MMVPLILLATGAVLSGVLFYGSFVGEGAHTFWRETIFVGEHGEEAIPAWVILAPFVASVLGLAVASYYFILHPELPAQMAAKQGLLYTFLYNKWYFDEIYDFLFVRPAKRLARALWKIGDGMIIDGLGPDGIAARVLDGTRAAVKLQTGYVYHYAFAMLVGAAALATWFLFSGQT
jgi:NADH-quinone oxidoreductase subunit L